MSLGGLLGVLIVARLLSLAGTPLPASFWTPIAYRWQDLAAVITLSVLDYVIHRARFGWAGWALYGLAVAYVALNVSIVRVLSSPLTLPMMRAARGPLADSIKYSLTGPNIGAILIVVCTGIVLPVALARWRPGRGTVIGLLVVSIGVVAAGPKAISKIDTAGRYRNAFGALWPVRVDESKRQETQNWRISPFPAAFRSTNELVRYRGAAAGRNVVMVLLESTAARYWPVSRPALDPMPNLTALASQGIFFEHAYAVYPESIKGLFSVLCSEYPSFNVPPEAYSGSPCPSLPQELANAGYRPALFHSGRLKYPGMPSVIEKRGFEVLEDAGTIGGNIHSSFGVDDLSTVKRILSWLDSLKPGDRFFVTYLPVAGHHPYATPTVGPFAASGAGSALNRYLDALHSGDQALGALLAVLR